MKLQLKKNRITFNIKFIYEQQVAMKNCYQTNLASKNYKKKENILQNKPNIYEDKWKTGHENNGNTSTINNFTNPINPLIHLY